MKEKVKPTKSRKRIYHKKCGTISCINNVCGLCYLDNCDLYENMLIQED